VDQLNMSASFRSRSDRSCLRRRDAMCNVSEQCVYSEQLFCFRQWRLQPSM